jgi:uncharacterized protein with beta-barrel porin domain
MHGDGHSAITVGQHSQDRNAHDWVSDATFTPVFQSLPGASFIVNGVVPAQNSALTSAGAELRLANGVTLLAKFDGEFALSLVDLWRDGDLPLSVLAWRESLG